LQGVTEADLRSFIRLNYPMTALMPFNGGVVELVTALVAMRGGDSVASVIKVMGDLSKMLVVPQLSAALGLALPIASGVQNLIGGADGQIHLGVLWLPKTPSGLKMQVFPPFVRSIQSANSRACNIVTSLLPAEISSRPAQYKLEDRPFYRCRPVRR
jgi:hypothetical protein